MHVTAPVAVPVFVIDPAAHTVHASTLDAVEYSPAGQAMQAVPPGAVPVSVLDPAAHAVHASTFDAVE